MCLYEMQMGNHAIHKKWDIRREHFMHLEENNVKSVCVLTSIKNRFITLLLCQWLYYYSILFCYFVLSEKAMVGGMQTNNNNKWINMQAKITHLTWCFSVKMSWVWRAVVPRALLHCEWAEAAVLGGGRESDVCGNDSKAIRW